METATISYRVADFLKRHPPFTTMAEQDLIELAAGGRVRFYEPNEYLLWQGEPLRYQIFVIQQGTVSLWDEQAESTELRDVRGAGDLLGVERYHNASTTLYSARSESDVVVYAFPADAFDALLEKYPKARAFVGAEGGVLLDYHATGERRDPGTMFLHQLVALQPVARCGTHTTVREAARRLLSGTSDVLAVVDEHQHPRALLTAESILEWIANGGTDSSTPVQQITTTAPVVVGPQATVTDGLLALGKTNSSALVITHDGTSTGRLNAVASTRDLATAFGEQPAVLLQAIRTASGTGALREANHRARAFASNYLTSAASVEWLAEFMHLTDATIFRRLLELADGATLDACWCFSGSSGRAESLTRLSPQVLVMLDKNQDRNPVLDVYHRVLDLLPDCDYLPRVAPAFDTGFYVASLPEWTNRFERWISSPVVEEMYRARRVFDLRPVHGPTAPWKEVEQLVARNVDSDFLQIVANDCLATLPPLTFFEDAVVAKSGEQTDVFHLEDSALRPLVDVGRVFALAARQAVGRSTLERFTIARTLLPEQQELFREAADTFRVVLWQQGRIGISEGTSGIDLPPSLLSRHDRHILKAGFRSILRLLQFTGNSSWITTP